MINSAGMNAKVARGLRVLLTVLVLLGVAFGPGRAAGVAPTSSTSHLGDYGSDCTSDKPPCLFHIGVAYCKFGNAGNGYGYEPDRTGLACYNMGRRVRVLTPYGWRIEHRGWAEITTGDSNKVVLFAHAYFILPGEGPDPGTPRQYRPVSSFQFAARYACRRYGDGATCTVPSDHYPGSLLAIYLTKRGGVWYRRIPDTGAQPALVHLDSFLSPDRKVWCRVIKDPTENDAWCGTQTPERLATVKPNGAVTNCNATGSGDCLQNWDSKATVLAYGHRSELNGFRCTSAQNGITCTVIAGTGQGKGFLINASGITKVG